MNLSNRLTSPALLLAGALSLLLTVMVKTSLSAPPPAVGDKAFRGFISAQCYSCHDTESQKGGLALDTLDAKFEDKATFDKWTRVFDRMRSGEMPPPAEPRPDAQDRALRDLQMQSQKDDGYLGDHVASSFHMAHYFRMVGQPTPKADAMVARVLRDQKADGGWNIKDPDWDVHACFDAVYVLRQLGGDTEPVRKAIAKAADWAMGCRNPDGGFGHYPKLHSDMDAVYFQFGTLIQAGRAPSARLDLPDGHTLSWGHAMHPGKIYTT